MSAFMQPPMPGYSPVTLSRQTSPFLQMPGAQGMQEGVSQGQGLAFSPTAQFFSGGTEGTAPPSSIPPNPDMWASFGGSGGAQSSTAAPQAANLGNATAVTNPGNGQFPNIGPLVAALRGGNNVGAGF